MKTIGSLEKGDKLYYIKVSFYHAEYGEAKIKKVYNKNLTRTDFWDEEFFSYIEKHIDIEVDEVIISAVINNPNKTTLTLLTDNGNGRYFFGSTLESIKHEAIKLVDEDLNMADSKLSNLKELKKTLEEIC